MSPALDNFPPRDCDVLPVTGAPDDVVTDHSGVELPTQRSVRLCRATAPQIEQAKGALMVVHGLTEEAAFALLRWYSQGSATKLRAIADRLTLQPEPEPLGDEASQKLTERLDTIARTGGP